MIISLPTKRISAISQSQTFLNLKSFTHKMAAKASLHQSYITDALISLHWLRVPVRIIFKVATLIYRALHGSAPPYLASSFTCVADMPHRRRLRSASTNSLTFRPVVGQLSEVVPFLLLEQRCRMSCQAMLRRLRRCRCSRTG